MTTGTLLAVCTVHALLPTEDATGVTAIDKRPVEGPVKVHPLGLTGDIQASRKHHGGPTKAVYAYSQQDADFWSGRLDREVAPGLFGENLRVYLAQLRKKLEPDPAHPRYFVTESGMGYRFDP